MMKTLTNKIVLFYFLSCILFCVMISSCFSFPQSRNDLLQAKCGVYVKSLGKFDYNKDSFFINFYIWWVTDQNFFPEKTAEISNAKTYSQLWAVRDILPSKLTRIIARYNAIIGTKWDFRAYPFDRQILRVSLEDSIADIDKMKFSVMSGESKISPDIYLEGWNVVRFLFVETPHIYSSNFGDKTKPFSVVSRLNMVFELKRDGWTTFFVSFMGFFLAAFMCFSSYFVEQINFADRNTLCLGAVFSAIGNKYHMDLSFSSVVGLSLKDTISISTFILIYLTILNSIRVVYLENRKRKEEALKINKINFIGFSSLYFMSIVTAVYIAVSS